MSRRDIDKIALVALGLVCVATADAAAGGIGLALGLRAGWMAMEDLHG